MCPDRTAVHTYSANAAQRKHKACACVWGAHLICKALPHSSLDHTTAASHGLWKGLPHAGEMLLTAKALNKNNQQNNWIPELALTELQSWLGVIQSHKTLLFAVECWGCKRCLAPSVPSTTVVHHWRDMRNSARSNFRWACLHNMLEVFVMKCQERVPEYHKNYKWSTSFLQLIYQGLYIICEIIFTVTFIWTSHY